MEPNVDIPTMSHLAQATTIAKPLGNFSILPLEIREEIYTLILTLSEANYPSLTVQHPYLGLIPHNHRHLLSVLLISKTIHGEAIKVLARANIFRLFIDRVIPHRRSATGYQNTAGWKWGLEIRSPMTMKFRERFDDEERDAFVAKGLMKELRSLTINIGLRNGNVRASDIKPWADGYTPTIASTTSMLPFLDILPQVIASMEGSTLSNLRIEMACRGAEPLGGVKEVLDVFSSLRMVKKCEVLVYGYREQWSVSEEYVRWMSDTMKQAWGVEAEEGVGEGGKTVSMLQYQDLPDDSSLEEWELRSIPRQESESEPEAEHAS